jgi:glycerol-1-phosphatase
MEGVTELGAADALAGDGDAMARIYDVALLDLDGVVYIGPDPVDHAAESLKAARGEGMRLAFVTNNASRPPRTVAAHLTELGIEAFDHEVITSAQAAARLLAERLPEGAKVLVVGGDGLVAAVEAMNLVPVSSMADQPMAVVQGFGPDVGWSALAEASYAVASGLLWVASNLDRTVPTPQGIAPGNGALVEVVRLATGREPIAAGKPEPPMHREAMLRTGAQRPLVVGDRLDTDIEGATRAGVDSLLVLTGVTPAQEAVLARPGLRPTHIGHDLRALHEPASALAVRAGQCTAGEWRAEVTRGRLLLAGPAEAGDDTNRLDALRAACGAAWAETDGLDPASVDAALAPWFTG